ncbi:MAG: VPLPA-CTERM sorting domain-containing protein [Paracoccaceae bacterium]
MRSITVFALLVAFSPDVASAVSVTFDLRLRLVTAEAECIGPSCSGLTPEERADQEEDALLNFNLSNISETGSFTFDSDMTAAGMPGVFVQDFDNEELPTTLFTTSGISGRQTFDVATATLSGGAGSGTGGLFSSTDNGFDGFDGFVSYTIAPSGGTLNISASTDPLFTISVAYVVTDVDGPPPVPLPASAILLASALGGIGAATWRRRARTAGARRRALHHEDAPSK